MLCTVKDCDSCDFCQMDTYAADLHEDACNGDVYYCQLEEFLEYRTIDDLLEWAKVHCPLNNEDYVFHKEKVDVC